MKRLWLLLPAFLFLTGVAFAGIPVSPANYTGSRTTPEISGIGSTGGYLEENGGFKIAWDISFDGTYWNYSYTLTNTDGTTVSPDVSHWIIQISPEIPLENIEDYIFDANATVVTPGGGFWVGDPNWPDTTQAGANNGNPNLPGDLIGVKFDTNSGAVSGVYTFKSVEPPIWGDFYIK